MSGSFFEICLKKDRSISKKQILSFLFFSPLKATNYPVMVFVIKVFCGLSFDIDKGELFWKVIAERFALILSL